MTICCGPVNPLVEELTGAGSASGGEAVRLRSRAGSPRSCPWGRDRPDDLRVLAPGLEREILWRLVTGDQGALVRQIGVASSSLTHISRAIRWIREHYNEPLLVADLAALSSMSASSFHRHFRAATSMTPIQFQKQIRLQEARALLMTQPAHVAEIGYLVGYESRSQFSREYRKTFGTPPGQDAARRGVPQHR